MIGVGRISIRSTDLRIDFDILEAQRSADVGALGQRLAQRNGDTDVGLLKDLAEVGRIAVEGLGGQGELTVHEPRFGDRDADIVALGAQSEIERKSLPAAGEATLEGVARVEEIEVGLLEVEETDNGIHGAETDTHTDGAGLFLIYQHIDIPVSTTSRNTDHVDAVEISEVLEAGLGGFEFNRVEHVAWLECHFTTDDLVLGLGITGNVHTSHLEFGALCDAVDDFDPVGAGILNIRVDHGIGVSLGAIVAADHLNVVAHLLGRVGVACEQTESWIQLLGLKYGHLAEADRIDGEFGPFVDLDHQIDATILDRHPLDAGAAGAQVALAAVEIENAIQIGIELVGFEATGLG